MEDVKQSLRVGDIFAGKYQVERVLGEGGMGVVIAATHVLTNDRVALKFLLPTAAEMPEVRQRFINEARAAVQIKSEHVARVTDVDTTPSGLPYMVMEYLEGHDLATVVEQQGALPLDVAVDYLLQACEALAEAHALRIVHRDLKPSNLFLTHRKDGSPLVKVLDFGISKLGAPGNAQLTRTGGSMGSPLYMSPEQMTNPKDVDARSDVWSLGVVLYELLTATWPFQADSFEGLIIQIATQQHAPLRAYRPDLPVDLEAIVGRCLEKAPPQRIASVGELAALLAPFGSAQAHASAQRVVRVLGAGGQAQAGAMGAEPSGAHRVAPLAGSPSATAQGVGTSAGGLEGRGAMGQETRPTWERSPAGASDTVMLPMATTPWRLIVGVAAAVVALGVTVTALMVRDEPGESAASSVGSGPTASAAALASSSSARAPAPPAAEATSAGGGPSATAAPPTATSKASSPRATTPAATAPTATTKKPTEAPPSKPTTGRKTGPIDLGGQ